MQGQPTSTATSSGVGSRFAELLNTPIVKLGEVKLSLAGILGALAVLVLAWLISIAVRRALARFSQRHADASRQAGFYTVGRIIHYLLLVVGVLIALDVIGLPASRFAVFAGALGVGLGFGLQAIFNNFVSGLILLFDRSLKIGDFVELESGVHGEVRDIKIRATRILTNDNLDILVPNSEFISGRVVNWTHRDVSRRLRVPFGVAYGSDRELAKKAALEAANDVPFTLEKSGPRGPQVWLVGFGDSSLDFELVVWLTAEATKRPSAVRAAYTWALAAALERHGLEIPFPQRDLHLRSAFGLQGDKALDALAALKTGARIAPTETESSPSMPTPLSHEERTRLARNDAKTEVEQEIARDNARATAPESNEKNTNDAS